METSRLIHTSRYIPNIGGIGHYGESSKNVISMNEFIYPSISEEISVSADDPDVSLVCTVFFTDRL